MSAATAGDEEHADVETASEDYARRFAGPVGAFFLEVQARETLRLLEPWPRASVLDVGGGHGQLTGPLLEAGYEVTIVGSAAACRDRVRRWLDAGRARFSVVNLLALPYADRAFDVVLSFRLLPHVRRWRELAGELARVARHAVVVDYPTRRSMNALAEPFYGLKKRVEGNTRPFAVFRDAEVEAAFADHGMRVGARRPQFLLPMALHRAAHAARLSAGVEAGARWSGLTSLLGSPVLLRLERDA